MIKLAIVRQKYRPDGGAEKFVASALEALQQHTEIELSVITREWQGAPQKQYHIIRCNPFKWGRVSRERGFAHRAQLFFPQFDLVQSHERIPGCDIFRAGDGVHRCWLKHRSRILSAQKAQAMMNDRFHRYVMAAEKAMFEHPNLKAVICNSQFIKQEIIDTFAVDGNKIHVIYNSVDLERFNPDLQALHRTEIRSRCNIPQDANVMLYVGSGFERKGVRSAIEAVAQTQAHLIVIGQDKRLSDYQALTRQLNCTDRIHFLGMQKNPESYYGAADAFLFPTLYDPFPNVILEAMASGLGVITSTACGAVDIIREQHNGYICDALDIQALASAINAFTDPELKGRLGENARTSVSHLTNQALSESLVNLYTQLIHHA